MPTEMILLVVAGLAAILLLVFRKQVAGFLKIPKKQERGEKQKYTDAIVACAAKAHWPDSWPNPAELCQYIENLPRSVTSSKMTLTKKVAKRFRFSSFRDTARALHRLEKDVLPAATAMMKKKKRK